MAGAPRLSQANIEIPVGVLRELCVEAAKFQHECSPGEHPAATARYDVGVEQQWETVGVALAQLSETEAAVIVVDTDLLAHRPVRVSGAHSVELCAELAGSPQVVVVAEGDPRRLGGGDADVARPGDAPV